MNKNKKSRHVITIIWGMVFCLNFFICLTIPEPTPLSWVLVGFPLGVALILLMELPLMNLQDELIDLQHRVIIGMLKTKGRKVKRWKI